MYEICYVDSQNLGPEGKKNQLARKRLSDITNTQTHHIVGMEATMISKCLPHTNVSCSRISTCTAKLSFLLLQ
ncbi:hypothetical protein ACHQM5_015025 [Ranunculus cassubicifolius]